MILYTFAYHFQRFEIRAYLLDTYICLLKKPDFICLKKNTKNDNELFWFFQNFQEKKGGTNPFATAPEPASSENNTPNILDLFGIPDGGAPAGGSGASATAAPASQASGGASDKASDDLLQLAGNPFASVLNATSSNSTQSAQSTAGLPAGGANSVPQQTLPSFSSSPFTAAATSSNTGNANGTISFSRWHTAHCSSLTGV